MSTKHSVQPDGPPCRQKGKTSHGMAPDGGTTDPVRLDVLNFSEFCQYDKKSN